MQAKLLATKLCIIACNTLIICNMHAACGMRHVACGMPPAYRQLSMLMLSVINMNFPALPWRADLNYSRAFASDFDFD